MTIKELCTTYNFNVIENDDIFAIPVEDILKYTHIGHTNKLIAKILKVEPTLKDVLFNKVVYSGKTHTNKKFIVLHDAVKFISSHGNPPNDHFVSDFESAFKNHKVIGKELALQGEHNIAIREADTQYHPMMTYEAVAPMVYKIVNTGCIINPREKLLPIFSEAYPFRTSQKIIDFVKQNNIQLIEPTFHDLNIIEQAMTRFEVCVLKSLIPFYHISVLQELFNHYSPPRFVMLYDNCRQELLNPPLYGCTDYELELRDKLIQFELDNNFLDYEVYTMTPDTHEMYLSSTPKAKRNEMFSLLKKGQSHKIPLVEKAIRIVFLHKKTIPYSQFPVNTTTNYQKTHNYNIDTLFKEPGYEMAHEYLQANLEKFGLQRPKTPITYTEEDDCLYFGKRQENMFYVHKKIRIPCSRMCPQLQDMYSSKFPGLDIDVDEDDLPLLNSVQWHMRKDGERIIIYHKPDNQPEQEMKYFLYSKLIADFPQYKLVIFTPPNQTCMCKYMLTILRLHTTTNRNGYDKSIPATIIKQRFEKYNAMSYQTITKLYQEALVVNGAQEILPQSSTTGLFTEVVHGNNWLTPDQMRKYRVLEQYNLLPNNDCNTQKIMTPLPIIDSPNGMDDPTQLRLPCDTSNDVTYLTSPERLRLA